jgi:D-apionolactonase
MRKEIILHGHHEPPLPMTLLRAGPLRLCFDQGTGFIRHIRHGKREVLRGIYAAVRDHNWGTVEGVVRDLKLDARQDSFDVEFSSEHLQEAVNFVWRGRISGDSGGRLTYEFEGEARNQFRKNRIGFCVLHPLECSGAPARQTRTDGSVLQCAFPSSIEPQIFGKASFRDLRSVAHEVAPGLWAEVEFDGDVFETEDQRNWTDASFKTYCTPLAIPFPVEIKAGGKVRQLVTLTIRNTSHASGGRDESQLEIAQPENGAPARLSVPRAPSNRMPAIGLGSASHGDALTDSEAAKLRTLCLGHLRADVRLSQPDWITTLERAGSDARKIGAKLELAVHLPRQGDPGLAPLLQCLRRIDATLSRVFSLREGEPATTHATFDAIKRSLKEFRVPIGSGSDWNFCEANRELALGRLAMEETDFIFWPINPQVHAFDNLSLIETLQAQSQTVNSMRLSSGGMPMVVSPVTLKQRFNPVATRPEPPPNPGQLPSQVDPRQLSLFGAGWTLGSIAALACAGIQSITYYETTGWRGLIETEVGSPLPDKFPSAKGALFPVFHVFAAASGCSHVAPVHLDKPLEAAGLALFKGEKLERVLAANLTGQPLEIAFEGLPWPAPEARLLSETNLREQPCNSPWALTGIELLSRADKILNLPPYSLAWISPRA